MRGSPILPDGRLVVEQQLRELAHVGDDRFGSRVMTAPFSLSARA